MIASEAEGGHVHFLQSLSHVCQSVTVEAEVDSLRKQCPVCEYYVQGIGNTPPLPIPPSPLQMAG